MPRLPAILLLCGAAAALVLVGVLIHSLHRVRNQAGTVPPPPPETGKVGEAGHRLFRHARRLSEEIGERSVARPENLRAAREYLVAHLSGLGLAPELESFDFAGASHANVIVSLPGRSRPEEVILVGAHYDTVAGTPGADDNASGVAVLLELGRALREVPLARTVRLVFFALEEPPAFRTRSMGSYVHAAAARARGEQIRAMVCLEMVGFYGEREGAQAFPLPLMGLVYPTTPNFVAVVGNLRSRRLVKRVGAALRRFPLPVETLACVSLLPGVDFSDHRSFWKMGYRAVMVTDTAFYRNPHYHGPGDTIDTLDFDRMAALAGGLVGVVRDLDGSP